MDGAELGPPRSATPAPTETVAAITEEAPSRRPGLTGRVAAGWRSGPLGVPAFRLLAVGQFTSTIGDYCYAVALPWLVLSGGGSAASLGVVLACYGIPRAALTVPGGSLADRFGPRLVMLSSDFARCALTVVLVVLAAAHESSLVAVAPVAALLGVFSALFLPASMTMMPSLIDASRLTAANALYTGFVQAGSMLGPVLGGILVAATGPATAFAIDAGSYLVSALCLVFIGSAAGAASPDAVADTAAAPAAGVGIGAVAPETDAPLPGAPALAAAVTETALAPEPVTAGTDALASSQAAAAAEPASVWVLLRHSRLLQIILVVSLTANFALLGTTEVALPALAHARFGADGYGAVLTCLAVASLLGALFVGRVGDRFRPAWLICGAFLIAAVAIASAPFLGGLPGVAAGMAVFGLAIGFDNVVSVTVIQRWAPPALLGRVWGLLLLASAGSFPVSTFIAGLLTRHLGPTAVFPITGALLALSMLYGLAHREFRAFGTE
jgi:MFS family permease